MKSIKVIETYNIAESEEDVMKELTKRNFFNKVQSLKESEELLAISNDTDKLYRITLLIEEIAKPAPLE